MSIQPSETGGHEDDEASSTGLPPLTEAEMPRSVEEIDAALLRLMAETEATVSRLREELAERRAHAVQHVEIERLEHHLAEATVNWSKVKEFFEEVLRELTGRERTSDIEDARELIDDDDAETEQR